MVRVRDVDGEEEYLLVSRALADPTQAASPRNRPWGGRFSGVDGVRRSR
jgi:hypothetical protein